MSTTTASSRTASVRWLIESRPPSLTWLRPTLPPSNQLPLDLSDHEIDRAEITRLNDRGVRGEYGQRALGGASAPGTA